ncbi:patatin-like phospholipase family protein [Caulobacter sp. KR2-114]|uniref:patatin-like phospholipase family protein n=1 Tax=Caulobacter sp. KR2-114 TaxID=3400912 RepID=UPI003C0BB17F
MSQALVLGGGGPVGIAWEAGLLAGLAEGGVDLAAADFIVGTSAGSVVGALLALGRPAADIAGPILAEAARPREIPQQAAQDRPGAPNMMLLMQKMAEVAAGERDPVTVRREIGEFALSAQTADEESFLGGFGRQLASAGEGVWPGRGYACTAVDTETGEFIVWNADSKVSLSRAVASSCSVPGVFPPITIGGRRYMDGGMRSATNADLAKGHDRTVVIAVRLLAGEIGDRMMAPVTREIEALRDAGGAVELIVPNEASSAAFAGNLMNPRNRPAAAQAGLDQGRALSTTLKSFWQ